jgi:hypothetical protein
MQNREEKLAGGCRLDVIGQRLAGLRVQSVAA